MPILLLTNFIGIFLEVPVAVESYDLATIQAYGMFYLLLSLHKSSDSTYHLIHTRYRLIFQNWRERNWNIQCPHSFYGGIQIIESLL